MIYKNHNVDYPINSNEKSCIISKMSNRNNNTIFMKKKKQMVVVPK